MCASWYCCSPSSGRARSGRQSNARRCGWPASSSVETMVSDATGGDTSTMISKPDIAAIEPLIRPHVRRTPVIEDGGVEFKLELLQHSGSFKARGAFANLLTRKVPRAGVVAASGGNHGAAVAYAARELGVPARIYVPTVSSKAKIDRIRGYGATLVVEGERYADALAASQRWAADSGALQVHAFDQEGALLGQGTIGMEWQAQTPGLDTLLVAGGRGGLHRGIGPA